MTLTLLNQPPEDPEPADSTLLAPPAGWPAPPDPAVYHELLGEIVNQIVPHTEADPVAILTQLLVSLDHVPHSCGSGHSGLVLTEFDA
jgi:hypothetical protein